MTKEQNNKKKKTTSIHFHSFLSLNTIKTHSIFIYKRFNPFPCIEVNLLTDIY